MANVTRNVTLSSFAYIQQTSPNTHITPNSSTWYVIGGYSNSRNDMLFKLAAWPSSLKRKKLIEASLIVQAKKISVSSLLDVLRNDADYNAATVTWANAPSYSSSICFDGRATEEAGSDISLTGRAPIVLAKALSAPSLRFSSNQFTSSIKTILSGGTAPYVTVTYDDAVNVPSKVSLTSGPSGTVDTNTALSFAWNLSTDTAVGYCADSNWTQASAKLYWRISGASSWNQISISGSAMSYNAPAFTFPSGKTINFYLSATDTDGNTSQTSVYSFDTYATQVTPITYPTGNSVDNRVAQAFSWDFVSASGATGYKQSSAIIYWRVSGAGTWNQISISGTTKSKSVAAYTFPANSTIEWYIRGTDYSGAVTNSQTYSFKTLGYTLAISSAPSGSNIDTRNAITFSWTISNTQGAVTQSSAIFYWRVSGASSYTQVSVSGNTKSVSVAANTFPTGKTVQWYVRATAADGTVLQSSATTFTTVSTRVTLDTYPSGNDVYTAAVLKWTWHLASNVGNYNQANAKLYWRVSTSSTYSQIAISGNTQSLNVPANTFPTNKTIQWYLEATDVGGLTSTTSTMSFKTVTTQITPQDSPTSGYTDPRYNIVFQWYFASSGGSVPQASATFYWKVSTASTYTSVAATGSTTKVTIPANTFPVASLIDWYISGTDVGGTTSTSQVYQISTTATTAYAWPQEPIGIAVDGSKPITLRWLLSNEDGTSPKRVTLEWKKPTDVSWTTIRSAEEAFTSWEVDAGTFPIGEIEWRVTATNRDNVDGPPGTAAFICLRAPDAPSGLSATAVPRTKIQWQGSGQQAYEISIDGVVVKKAYGIDVSDWTPDFVLEDGIHTISVRIQGSYGYWSDYSETTISVQNIVPAEWENLSLTGSFGVDAVLTADGATIADANWFRDGKRIAVTHGLTSFTDRFVLGLHSYYVELWSEDGNYARSNVVEGTMKSCITRIALFEGGEWIDLRLSAASDSVQEFTYGRTGSLRHVLGTRYPVLEISNFEDESGTYDCAFKDVQSAAEFEALRGKIVILKSRGGNVLIGALTTLGKQYTDFYITYSFTVQQIDWEDFTDVSTVD